MEFDAHHDAFRSVVGADERLLWSGRPPRGLLFRGHDAVVMPAGIAVLAFSVFWVYQSINVHAPLAFVLWSVPIVASALYIVAGRFFVDAWHRANTYYGVTDQRVLFVSGARGSKVKSINLRAMVDVSLNEKPSGVGSIAFGTVEVPVPTGFLRASPDPAPRNVFELIPNARSVYDLIRRAQSAAR